MICDSLKNINYFKLQPLPSLKELLFLSMIETSECILLCIFYDNTIHLRHTKLLLDPKWNSTKFMY